MSIPWEIVEIKKATRSNKARIPFAKVHDGMTQEVIVQDKDTEISYKLFLPAKNPWNNREWTNLELLEYLEAHYTFYKVYATRMEDNFYQLSEVFSFKDLREQSQAEVLLNLINEGRKEAALPEITMQDYKSLVHKKLLSVSSNLDKEIKSAKL